LLEGIKKWLEETTMLPSDHHLRIYKLLGKHACKKKTHKEEPDDTQDDTRIKQGCDILFAIFDIMLLAIHHEYPL